MDIIPKYTTSSTSSTSSTSFPSTKKSDNNKIYLAQGFENLQHVTSQTSQSIGDIFEANTDKPINDTTKITLNRFLRYYEPNQTGFDSILYLLGINHSEVSEFVDFIESSKDDLNLLLDYDDDLKQLYMCSLYGIIFSWFRIIYNTSLTQNRQSNNFNFIVNQPELVSLFRCQCGGSIFPAHDCYVDGVCTSCDMKFELKDHSGIEYTNINQLLNQNIRGGSVNSQKFQLLQTENTRPELLLFVRFKGEEFKRLYKIPSNFYTISYDKYDRSKQYNSTIIQIRTINETMREETIDERIQFFIDSFQIRGGNSCLKKSLRKDTPSSVSLKSILNNLLNRLLLILQRENRNETLQRVILQKQEKCQLKSVIQGIIACMRNSDY